MTETRLDAALHGAVTDLTDFDARCALVGGLAVSLRAQVRFTRDVDLAVRVANDAEVEVLVGALRGRGYGVKALVEHDDAHRIAIVRLTAPAGVVLDLLVASSGIESEVVERADLVSWSETTSVHVARKEELLALKVLSASERRMQDTLDAHALIHAGADVEAVRANLAAISRRGYDRGQDLMAKFAALVESARG